MGNRNYQDDFFGNQFSEKKDGPIRRLKTYSKRRFLPYVKIPVEYFVIFFIGFLVLVIVSYAVGIEKGKKIAELNILKENNAEEFLRESYSEKETVLETETIEGNISKKDTEEVFLFEEDKKLLEAQKKDINEAQQIKTKPISVKTPKYILQLASVKNRVSAEQELGTLKNKGFDAKIKKIGNWYQIYLNGYKTLQQAEDAKKVVVTEYKDCFIRKIE